MTFATPRHPASSVLRQRWDATTFRESSQRRQQFRARPHHQHKTVNLVLGRTWKLAIALPFVASWCTFHVVRPGSGLGFLLQERLFVDHGNIETELGATSLIRSCSRL